MIYVILAEKFTKFIYSKLHVKDTASFLLLILFVWSEIGAITLGLAYLTDPLL